MIHNMPTREREELRKQWDLVSCPNGAHAIKASPATCEHCLIMDLKEALDPHKMAVKSARRIVEHVLREAGLRR